MKNYQDEAIVLKTQAYGESDLIVSFFTKENGRIQTMAKGAKRSKRRFGPVLEMGSWIDIVYEERLHREFFFLKEATGKQNLASWRKSWMTITMASYALEVVMRLLPLHQNALPRFQLLKRFLENLTEEEALLHLILFEFQWLCLSGWAPNLDHCGVCHKNWNQESDWQLLLERGEILCSKCRLDKNGLIHSEVLELLKKGRGSERLFSNSTVPKLVGAQKLFSQYWAHLLGKPLKSSKLLEKTLLS